jgi:ABC-type glycerol-3-phosphate transport system permease component
MTNSMLGYIKDLVTAVIGLLIVFDIIGWTENQIAAVLLVVSALGAVILALNTAKGKPSEIRDAARTQGVDVGSI